MNADYREVVQKLDSHLNAHPNASLLAVAETLRTTCRTIEEALQKIEGLSFDEYQSGKRLAQAFSQMGEMSPAANGPYEMVRARRRITIPRATVQYRMAGFWQRKTGFSGHCPLVDLSQDGLAFLSDRAGKRDKRLLLILKVPGEESPLQLRAHVVYSVATGIVGYRFRIGVQFLPFDERGSCNSIQARDAIARLEKTYVP